MLVFVRSTQWARVILCILLLLDFLLYIFCIFSLNFINDVRNVVQPSHYLKPVHHPKERNSVPNKQ